MPNVNDVIKGLERCLAFECDDCNQPDKSGYPWDCEGFDRMVNEAVVLLKEYAEMEKIYSQVLMETTGNLLSKTNYTLTAIMDCIREHYCDGCNIREEFDTLLKVQEPPTNTSISNAIECLLHPQDADDSDMAQAIDTAVRAMRSLQEREPMRPGIGTIYHDDESISYFLHCPFDGTTLVDGDNYCRRCGRRVKW